MATTASPTCKCHSCSNPTPKPSFELELKAQLIASHLPIGGEVVMVAQQDSHLYLFLLRAAVDGYDRHYVGMGLKGAEALEVAVGKATQQLREYLAKEKKEVKVEIKKEEDKQ